MCQRALAVTTADHNNEPAFHRRGRAKRANARAILRVAKASSLLANHHSAQQMPYYGTANSKSKEWDCPSCETKANRGWRMWCRLCGLQRPGSNQQSFSKVAAAPSPQVKTLQAQIQKLKAENKKLTEGDSSTIEADPNQDVLDAIAKFDVLIKAATGDAMADTRQDLQAKQLELRKRFQSAKPLPIQHVAASRKLAAAEKSLEKLREGLAAKQSQLEAIQANIVEQHEAIAAKEAEIMRHRDVYLRTQASGPEVPEVLIADVYFGDSEADQQRTNSQAENKQLLELWEHKRPSKEPPSKPSSNSQAPVDKDKSDAAGGVPLADGLALVDVFDVDMDQMWNVVQGVESKRDLEQLVQAQWFERTKQG